jgi:choline kinase
MSKTTKAIIVAAGRGRRLADSTAEIPKCMVRVNGRPILHWQLRALAAAGIDDVFIDNPEWQSNNILTSLMYAADEFADGFFFSYCDIVYPPSVVAKLAASTGSPASSLVVDRRWADAYQGRTLHPVTEAELTSVSNGRVLRVGKGAVDAAQAVGEFIGLAHFSPTGAAALSSVWQQALASHGLDAPFGRAKALRQAYLTDALNAMADSGLHLAPVFIDGEWREIDTQQDLRAAEMNTHLWSG